MKQVNQKMMGILAQITTTVLTLVLTLLAGYVIFLSTQRANIDAEIQSKGARIVDELRRSATFDIPLSYTDFFLIQHYHSKHPNLAGPSLLYRIVYDLLTDTLFKMEKSHAEIPDIAAKGNIPGSLAGRISLWVVQRSIVSLVPSEVPWPGHASTRIFLQIPDTPQIPQESLFPFGPLGVENWISEFRSVQQTIELISGTIFKELILADLQQFRKNAAGLPKESQSFDYRNWLEKMQTTATAITAQADQISSLLRLRNTLSIRSRLPNIFWLALLAATLLCLGIILPLTIIGLGLDVRVPPAVNITLMAVVLIVSLGVIWVLAGDITKSPEKEFPGIRYLVPLRTQLLSDERKQYSEVTSGFELLSRVLADVGKLGLLQKEINLLEDLRNAIRASNSISEEVAEQLAIEFRSSAILTKYRATPGSGGKSLPILQPIELKKSEILVAIELQAGTNIIVQDIRGHVTTDVLALEIPRNQQLIDEIHREITRIYEKVLSDKNYKALQDARLKLNGARQAVLDWLNKKIQSANE